MKRMKKWIGATLLLASVSAQSQSNQYWHWLYKTTLTHAGQVNKVTSVATTKLYSPDEYIIGSHEVTANASGYCEFYLLLSEIKQSI